MNKHIYIVIEVFANLYISDPIVAEDFIKATIIAANIALKRERKKGDDNIYDEARMELENYGSYDYGEGDDYTVIHVIKIPVN